MLVTLELGDSAPDRPTGWVRVEGQRELLAFDGWLDLMRLIESLKSAGAASGGRPGPAKERET